MKIKSHQILQSRRGLSLFELLVVMTIAAILGGLAFVGTTNIIHRTKHQRVLEEHRIIVRALQNYSLDHGDIPAARQGLDPLIRPTVYMGSMPRDPFQKGDHSSYLYLVPNSREIAAVLISPGPDGRFHLPQELWQFAHPFNVDERMVPSGVRMRLAQERRIGQIGVAAASAVSGDEATPRSASATVMSEAQLAILMTYINLAQYHPDRGTEGDIITVTYH